MGISPLARNILIGIPIGVTFLDTVGYVARVEGVSMQPALNPVAEQAEDYVYLNRWAVRGYKIERGDIVSLSSPKFPSQKLIKRVIGLPGDVLGTIGYKNEFVQVEYLEYRSCGKLSRRIECESEPEYFYFRFPRAIAGSKATTRVILWTLIPSVQFRLV